MEHEKIIYEWLNKCNILDSPSKLIDCLLILSTNGVLIEYHSLINYCNNKTNHHGLNEKQFQTLNNNIKSLKDIYNSNNDNSNNSNSSRNMTKLKLDINSKFDCSISIILQNNQNHMENNDKSKRNIIIINKKRKPSLLFFLVWRNIVIRNEILIHARLFNLHLNKTVELYVEEIGSYKYLEYIGRVSIYPRENDNIDDNGDQVYTVLEPHSLPYSITEITIGGNVQLVKNSLPNSINTVTFNHYETNQVFTVGILPDSITSLQFGENGYFNNSLDGCWLPKSLKSLKFENCEFQQPIRLGDLPDTLIELVLHVSYAGIIEAGSVPKNVRNLDFIHKNTNKNQVPVSTTNLEFYYTFNKTISVGDISHNVTSLTVGHMFDSEIEIGSLPLSLKSLILKRYFNIPLKPKVLPAHLTYIDMGGYNLPLTFNMFPKSIESIKFIHFDHPIPEGYFNDYTNLSTLEYGTRYNQIITSKSLPPSLTSLILGKLDTIPVLPSSVKKLILKSPTTIEPGNQLSTSSVTSLSLDTRHDIHPGVLPHNLKELYIIGTSFSQDLSEYKGVIPESVHSIYISKNNIKYNTNLDLNFLLKYIKIIN